MTNAVNWFEIPVKNFDRAKKFYSIILGEEVIDAPMEGMKYGILPHDKESQGVGGGIVEMDGYAPSQEGSLVYLNGGVDLELPLSRVERAGGKIVMPKTAIGEDGFIAQFLDTEGNKVAFHSMN
ncbi:VOC family protein [Pontimicrobium sp. SW4]|uniref:VOC family protein n=1 Tax=Pontimicrobium sp. SW4 TaxID=3153519 RepID=A0AAU7BWY7_9FLAO